jgi:hypothetical protein
LSDCLDSDQQPRGQSRSSSMKVSKLKTYLRDRRLRSCVGLLMGSATGACSGSWAGGGSGSTLSLCRLHHRLPIRFVSVIATVIVGTAQSARNKASIAAPRESARREIMYPAAASSRSKAICQLGLSGNTFTVRLSDFPLTQEDHQVHPSRSLHAPGMPTSARREKPSGNSF